MRKANAVSTEIQVKLNAVETELEEKKKEIETLRQNLNYALAMYENKIEEERERFDTNKDKNIQIMPKVADKYCQVEFIHAKKNESRIADAKGLGLLCNRTDEFRNFKRYYPPNLEENQASVIVNRFRI